MLKLAVTGTGSLVQEMVLKESVIEVIKNLPTSENAEVFLEVTRYGVSEAINVSKRIPPFSSRLMDIVIRMLEEEGYTGITTLREIQERFMPVCAGYMSKHEYLGERAQAIEDIRQWVFSRGGHGEDMGSRVRPHPLWILMEVMGKLSSPDRHEQIKGIVQFCKEIHEYRRDLEMVVEIEKVFVLSVVDLFKNGIPFFKDLVPEIDK